MTPGTDRTDPAHPVEAVDGIDSAAEPRQVMIRDQAIKLGQLLKLAGLVEDGVMARTLIEEGHVRVDGEVEQRRGRQVDLGSFVDVDGTVIRVTSG
ncbi:MAG TPA: RNA-binding S4 domain-containing protein [Segeticoccus sp.]|uniref:RNA-binding S4 domain-containing protein n=1 Tax=Segeticoccus sp. TaxID=2706531 RepID=UPI002D7E856D|nr:RNA-binding S4 domain-containing protein [Segeticoccus sp.]HET8601958.1 RNA-binding S4 domain-containing protein [Segeticoccus sp.]